MVAIKTIYYCIEFEDSRIIYHYPAPETLGICYSFSDHTRAFCGFFIKIKNELRYKNLKSSYHYH